MRWLLLVLLLTPLQLLLAAKPKVAELRTLYYRSPTNKAAAEQFIDAMEEVDDANMPLLKCYKGLALLLKAKHAVNPYVKLATFNKGRTMLDRAVDQEPDNIEIRFARFCVQTTAPSFLGYYKEINEDKQAMILQWQKIIDDDLRVRIKEYLLSSGHCNDKEKSILR